MDEQLIKNAQQQSKSKPRQRYRKKRVADFLEAVKSKLHHSEREVYTRRCQYKHRTNILTGIKQFFSMGCLQNLTKRLWWVLLVVLGIILIYFLLTHERFGIHTIIFQEIDGGELKYSDRQRLNIQANKILIGQNYFLVNTTEMVIKIEENPFIKYVVVDKQFPDTIKFKIKEYTPYITFYNNKSECITVNKEAYVLDLQSFEEVTEENLDGETNSNENKPTSNVQCLQVSKHYKTIFVELSNNKQPFKLGEQSNQYLVTGTEKIVSVLGEEGYDIKKMSVRKNYCEVTTLQTKIFIFTIEKGLEEQLQRFRIIHKNLGADMKDFNLLDLRYTRPVMK